VAAGVISFAAGTKAKALHAGAFVWADSSTGLPFTSTGDNQFLIQADGGVGIGTNNPAAKLEVVSTGSRTISAHNTKTTGDNIAVWGQSDGIFGRGVFGHATGGSGVNYGVWGQSGSSNGRGVFGFATATSGTNYGVLGTTFSPNGYGVYSNGDYGGNGAKFFVQPHPYDPSKEIRFVCLEGNESGTYFRGSTHLENGRAYIDVPEEFRLVSEHDGLTVQLTAMGPDAGLWVESKDLNQIVVVGNGNVEFDYFINGVRRGFADMELVRENHAYVPEVRGVPYGTQFRPAHRQILVENGILNPDFTPNERTAALLGWTLREPTPEDVMLATPDHNGDNK